MRKIKDKISMSARVTVVIVNYNAGDLLRRSVSSALDCSSVHSVIISDNNSTDSSLNSLQGFLPDSRLRIIQNGKNLGFAAANNRGLTGIETPYVLFLNPDAKINDTTLEVLTGYMESHPQVGMSGPLVLNEDGSEQRGCRRSEPTPLAAWNTIVGWRNKGINQLGRPLPEEAVEVDAISGSAMFVRRMALEQVGPMDEGYFLHCEDLDWCKRFWLAGWKIVFVPGVAVTHLQGGSSRSRPIRVEWHKHRGMARYYSKFYKDRYPKSLMLLVYISIWIRFFTMIPGLALKRLAN